MHCLLQSYCNQALHHNSLVWPDYFFSVTAHVNWKLNYKCLLQKGSGTVSIGHSFLITLTTMESVNGFQQVFIHNWVCSCFCATSSEPFAAVIKADDTMPKLVCNCPYKISHTFCHGIFHHTMHYVTVKQNLHWIETLLRTHSTPSSWILNVGLVVGEDLLESI